MSWYDNLRGIILARIKVENKKRNLSKAITLVLGASVLLCILIAANTPSVALMVFSVLFASELFVIASLFIGIKEAEKKSEALLLIGKHIHETGCGLSGEVKRIEPRRLRSLAFGCISWKTGGAYTFEEYIRTQCSECGSVTAWPQSQVHERFKEQR